MYDYSIRCVLPLLVTELAMAPAGVSVLILLVDKVAAVAAAG